MGLRQAVFASKTVIFEVTLGNRLKKLTDDLNDANSTAIVFEYVKYDKVGNRLRMKVDNNNAHVYAYDKLYQLTFVDYNNGNSTGYWYDKLGNRTSVISGGTTNYLRNRLNQYTSVGGTNYTYDPNENLTYDGQYTYIYDCENRLTEVKQGATAIATYRDDYLGRRGLE